MASLTAVDAKGNVYMVPANVLSKYCKKLGNIKEKKTRHMGGIPHTHSDWPNCYLWINGDNPPWINCPDISHGDRELWARAKKARDQKVKAQKAKAKKVAAKKLGAKKS